MYPACVIRFCRTWRLLSEVNKRLSERASLASLRSKSLKASHFVLASQSPTDARPRALADRQQLASGQYIPLIDDDEDLRAVISGALRALGNNVADFPDGPSGLKALAETKPDVLVVDFAMPGINGAEVARAAREVWTDLPVVLATGYADTDAIESAIGNEAHLLRKPFRIDELLDAVSAVAELP